MSEPTDKPLHDWVRESLETYRPDYDPNDWKNLQRTLRRRRWRRWGSWLIGTIVLVAIIRWLSLPQLSTKNTESKLSNVISHSERQPALAPQLVQQTTIGDSLTALESVHHLTSIAHRPSSSRQPSRSAFVTTPAFLSALTQPAPLSNQLTEQIPQRQPVTFSTEEMAITEQILTSNFGSDSTSYQVLDRNLRAWPDAIIVCDFTTSMYSYSTQLFAWFKQHARHPAVKGMVFFTDCDSLGRQTQPGGPPGQMFVTRGTDPGKILPTLLAAARNTIRNDDDAENDVEALLYAQEQFPETKHLILLADNISKVKDMALLSKVKKPVHVILCGTTGSDTTIAYQSEYHAIASRTNGSLHTLEDDLSPSTLSSTTTLRVGPRYFRYLPRKQRFKPTTFDHRPKRILKFIWF